MKQCLLAGFLMLAALIADAQWRFDSAAYVNHLRQHFPPNHFDTTLKREELTAEEMLEGLSKMWYETKINFANFDLIPALNWDSAYRAFIPKVLATKGIIDYYKVLKVFNQLLRDGHSRVMEPPYYFLQTIGIVPLAFRYMEGKVVLSEIEGKDATYQALRKGWILETIDDIPVQQYIREYVSPYLNFSTPQDSMARIYRFELLRGKPGTTVTLQFLDLNQQKQRIRLERVRWNDGGEVLRFTKLPGNIGYLELKSFAHEKIVQQFDSLFDELCTTDALIIDVRTNGGGNGGYGYEILGRLTQQPFRLTWGVLHRYSATHRAWSNDPIQLEIHKYDWKPYKTGTYAKPVILLTGASTYSAAEDFTAAFKYMQRGIIVGEPTGGSTGQPVGYDLPGGGIAYVCTKRDVMPDGEEFIGKGIMPDTMLTPTFKGLQAQKDEVLAYALKTIQQQLQQKKNY